jgi:ABC-type transport system substrate-binding protein
MVHCLIPNMRSELLRKRAFRRALVYGIHRQRILDQLTGGELAGCQVISGPFPPGFAFDDPLGYAYDRSIEPRGYEPRLAIALAGLAVNELAAAKKRKGEELKETPTLVLAHPPGEIATTACQSIRQQLELIGVPVELKPLAGPLPRRIPDGIDLLYAELALWEPVVDARRLMGSDGITGGCSAYMSLALRRLDEAGDWQQVHARLRRMHLIAHRDVAVIPLWQLVEHFAYHRSIKGIGSRPVSLYQNIEQWQVEFQYPKEDEGD